MSDNTHLRFLARAQEPNRWAGAAPLPPLDVEGALAAVLARAEVSEVAPQFPQSASPQRAEGRPAYRARRRSRWTRALAAALLMIGGFAPWLAGLQGPESQGEGSQGVLAVSTAAVVYSQHSGSKG